MRRLILSIFIIFLLTGCSVFAKNAEKLDVNSGSFMDLSRYAETFEINEEDSNKTEEKKEDDTDFEETAINDITKRYEQNAVELKLDDIDDNALTSVNGERMFKLHINETQYKIEQEIKAENMIWDGSKSFSNAFLTDTRHMAPIPSVVNSQVIKSNISNSLNASLGQTTLNDANGTSVLFVRNNESTYNTGSVISYKNDLFNLSVGSFNSSFNQAASGGAILSTKAVDLPKSIGSISLGGAYFAKEEQEDNRTTGGIFGEYKYKRLKLNAQIGQSKYTSSNNYDTSLYFIPEYQISKSLYLKTRFIRNITQKTNQDELALTYKPFNNKNNLEIELNASNQYTDESTIRQRLKLSTSFRF